VRHRAKLVALRSGLKAQVHAVLAKQGVRVPMSDLFGAAGRQLLDELRLDPPYHTRVASLRRLIDAVDSEIDTAGRQVSAQLSEDPGWRAVQTIDGIGPVLASVFVAEIGDVHRFARPEQLCSWAGLTPNMAATFLVGLVFAFNSENRHLDLNLYQWLACLAMFALGIVAAKRGWLTAIPDRLRWQKRRRDSGGPHCVQALHRLRRRRRDRRTDLGRRLELVRVRLRRPGECPGGVSGRCGCSPWLSGV
jgi:hypothetical protein